jgi:hypothetical protein
MFLASKVKSDSIVWIVLSMYIETVLKVDLALSSGVSSPSPILRVSYFIVSKILMS